MLPLNDNQDLRSMLDRIRGIRHACDLDLLLFFYRHPRVLLTGDRLVAYLGYDREQVALPKSLVSGAALHPGARCAAGRPAVVFPENRRHPGGPPGSDAVARRG
jgi:hypothetical protein